MNITDIEKEIAELKVLVRGPNCPPQFEQELKELLEPEVALVGFEAGTLREPHIEWGHAALKHGDLLVNPTTHQSQPWSDAARLVESGSLVLFPHQIRVPTPALRIPLVVLTVRNSSPYRDLILSVDNKALEAFLVGDHTALVFANSKRFDAYTDLMVEKIIAQEGATESVSEKVALIELGLRLNCKDPALKKRRGELRLIAALERVDLDGASHELPEKFLQPMDTPTTVPAELVLRSHD